MMAASEPTSLLSADKDNLDLHYGDYLGALTFVWVVSLLRIEITPIHSLLFSTIIIDSEFDKMPKDFSPKHLISISTLLFIFNKAGLRAISEGTCYCRTRLTFHPYSQITRGQYTNGSGPPCSFRHISSCPGIDRPASGSFQVINNALITRTFLIIKIAKDLLSLWLHTYLVLNLTT